jgi:hypothetical protein
VERFRAVGRIRESKPPINVQHQKQANIKNRLEKYERGQVQGFVYGGLLSRIRPTALQLFGVTI